MTSTLTDSGAVKLRAGANASSTITDSLASMETFINQSEAYVMSISEVDWVAQYSTLSATTKLILDMTASAHSAVGVITNDMSGFTSRFEASQMLNVNWSIVIEGIKLLKQSAVKQDFLGGKGKIT